MDLAKAYDRLRWSFINQVLNEVGLPQNLICFIMIRISSVKTNVMWNGNRSEFFNPERGIRPGDPLSPYIFVLCMDKLSHLISQAVDEGEWKPMRAGRNGPNISHLMFADDLLLFGIAKEPQMQCVLGVLNNFCLMLGQQIDHDKTNILFSKNVPNELRRTLLTQSGFRETFSLGKYLGVLILGRAPRKGDFQYIVEKVKLKLSGWKAKQLSFAGRVTLSKAVIQAIPIYPMMSTDIPRSCLQEIQKLQRAFVWGEEENQRKAHLINWKTLMNPKELGGLAIRNLSTMNVCMFNEAGMESTKQRVESLVSSFRS